MENSINTANNIKNIVLGAPITLDDFIAVARYGAAVEFSEEYCRRVEKSRELVEQWVSEEKVMYGVTTGFGALCTKAIGKDETAKLQENIILSHSVSVGNRCLLSGSGESCLWYSKIWARVIPESA